MAKKWSKRLKCKKYKKRKNKKLKRKRIKRVNRVRIDTHHIFFMRKTWDRLGYRKLRTFPYCMVPLERDTLHRYIHSNMHNIPTPEPIAVEEALKQLRMLDSAGVLLNDDPIEKRITLLAALFDCSAQPTADALREQLELVYRFKNEQPSE